MESFWILGSIAFALMLGAMSPGPTSIYVAKNSIAISRKHGLFTALGTGTGAAIFGLLAVLGLQAFYWLCRLPIWLLKFVVVYICSGWLLKLSSMPKSRSMQAMTIKLRCPYVVPI